MVEGSLALASLLRASYSLFRLCCFKLKKHQERLRLAAQFDAEKRDESSASGLERVLVSALFGRNGSLMVGDFRLVSCSVTL